MKKLMNFGMGLCLLAALFTGCEEKPLDETGGGSGGDTSEDVRGGIEGVVTDKAAGALVSQALVELLPTDRKTRTDDMGAFSFSDLKAGTYQVRVSKDGYETYTSDDIAVKSGQTVRRAIVLEKELTDLQILDTADNMLSVLDLGTMRRGVFKLKNPGSTIVEWEIPTLSEEWIDFSKQSGKLASGAVETVELTINWEKMPSEENEAVVYICSTVGTLQMKVRVVMYGETYKETAFGMSLQMVEVVGCPIYIGKYEITQAQWKAVMGTNPSYFRGNDLPVENVSWNDAVRFCNKLSERTGKKYRLPTESEWEYAARGGHNVDGTEYAGSDNINEVAWYGSNNGGTHEVGRLKPNGLGVYDMSGNVWEWCRDCDDSNCSYRVHCGGSWNSHASNCRVSAGEYHWPDYDNWNLGFRVVCER